MPLRPVSIARRPSAAVLLARRPSAAMVAAAKDLADDDEHRAHRTCAAAVCAALALFVYFAGAVTFYLKHEGWSMVDTIYFTVALLTTVGYGDLHPTTPTSRLVTSCFSLLSMACLGYALVLLVHAMMVAEEAATRRLARASQLGRRRPSGQGWHTNALGLVRVPGEARAREHKPAERVVSVEARAMTVPGDAPTSPPPSPPPPGSPPAARAPPPPGAPSQPLPPPALRTPSGARPPPLRIPAETRATDFLQVPGVGPTRKPGGHERQSHVPSRRTSRAGTPPKSPSVRERAAALRSAAATVVARANTKRRGLHAPLPRVEGPLGCARALARLSVPIALALLSGTLIAVLVEGLGVADGFYWAATTVSLCGVRVRARARCVCVRACVWRAWGARAREWSVLCAGRRSLRARPRATRPSGIGDVATSSVPGRAAACVFIPLSTGAVARSLRDVGQFVSTQWTLRRAARAQLLLLQADDDDAETSGGAGARPLGGGAASGAELSEDGFVALALAKLYGVDAELLRQLREQFAKLDPARKRGSVAPTLPLDELFVRAVTHRARARAPPTSPSRGGAQRHRAIGRCVSMPLLANGVLPPLPRAPDAPLPEEAATVSAAEPSSGAEPAPSPGCASAGADGPGGRQLSSVCATALGAVGADDGADGSGRHNANKLRGGRRTFASRSMEAFVASRGVTPSVEERPLVPRRRSSLAQ